MWIKTANLYVWILNAVEISNMLYFCWCSYSKNFNPLCYFNILLIKFLINKTSCYNSNPNIVELTFALSFCRSENDKW